jgi:acetyl esterase/lipase
MTLSKEANDRKKRLFAAYADSVDFLLNTPLDIQRQSWESSASQATLPVGTSIESVDSEGISAEWISSQENTNGKVILYFHGGGNSQGSCLTHRKLVAYLAHYSHCRILLVEYPLAPENPFPAALLYCRQVWLWLLAEGYSATEIMLAGDSSGGGLVMSLMLLLKQHGDPLPDSAILLSPMLDFTLSAPSITRCRGVDPLICVEDLLMTARYYCSDRERGSPLVSPLFGELTGLPPLFIQVGSDELLLDDALRLSERAEKAGVAVTLEVWEGLWHVFQSSAGKVPEADRALQSIASFIRSRHVIIGCNVPDGQEYSA